MIGIVNDAMSSRLGLVFASYDTKHNLHKDNIKPNVPCRPSKLFSFSRVNL